MAKMAAKLITYLACTLLVLAPFVTKSDAFGNGPSVTCPDGKKSCHEKKMLMDRDDNALRAKRRLCDAAERMGCRTER